MQIAARTGVLVSVNVTRRRYEVLPPTWRQHLIRKLWVFSRLRGWLLDHGFTPDRLGRLLGEDQVHNMVPTSGLNLIRDLLRGTVAVGITYFALGAGTTAAAAGDVKLQTELYRDTLTSTAVANGHLYAKYYLPSTAGNGNSYTEAGECGGAATATTDSGTLYARSVFAADAKTTAQAWTFTWDNSFADDGVA